MKKAIFILLAVILFFVLLSFNVFSLKILDDWDNEYVNWTPQANIGGNDDNDDKWGVVSADFAHCNGGEDCETICIDVLVQEDMTEGIYDVVAHGGSSNNNLHVYLNGSTSPILVTDDGNGATGQNLSIRWWIGTGYNNSFCIRDQGLAVHGQFKELDIAFIESIPSGETTPPNVTIIAPSNNTWNRTLDINYS